MVNIEISNKDLIGIKKIIIFDVLPIIGMCQSADVTAKPALGILQKCQLIKA